MKALLIRIANFLRLIDETGNLSITNIAVMIVVVKMALCVTCSMADFAALLTVLVSYHFKRYINTQKPLKLPEKDLEELKGQINSIKLKLGLNNERRLG